jgi:hypothetical protein
VSRGYVEHGTPTQKAHVKFRPISEVSGFYRCNLHAMHQIQRMPIYLFWSQRDVAIFGFTLEPAGRNLPIEFAPWSKNGDGAALHEAAPDANLPFNAIVQAIERDGFYLARTELLRGLPPGHNGGYTIH